VRCQRLYRAVSELPRRAEQARKDSLRSQHAAIRGPVPILADARRIVARAGCAAALALVSEVPVRFAESIWLFGALTGLVVAAFLILGGFKHLRALRRFGDEQLVTGLVTHPAGTRRAFEGVCLTLAVALAFVALAQPQYGRGTRLIPATNLDVVLVLDYSKSMYAKDVAPSRTLRAVSEVGRLIQELPGARFGAVAFAGQPMSFPLTSDGAAIAQFFRQLSPNDMPVGGTAIARALEAGRDLLQRDPLSQKHRRVMVLVTDGEDLEGDPVAVARDAHLSEITVHVVQIGGRTPE